LPLFYSPESPWQETPEYFVTQQPATAREFYMPAGLLQKACVNHFFDLLATMYQYIYAKAAMHINHVDAFTQPQAEYGRFSKF